jgi:hypothetical protein
MKSFRISPRLRLSFLSSMLIIALIAIGLRSIPIWKERRDQAARWAAEAQRQRAFAVRIRRMPTQNGFLPAGIPSLSTQLQVVESCERLAQAYRQAAWRPWENAPNEKSYLRRRIPKWADIDPTKDPHRPSAIDAIVHGVGDAERPPAAAK